MQPGHTFHDSDVGFEWVASNDDVTWLRVVANVRARVEEHFAAGRQLGSHGFAGHAETTAASEKPQQMLSDAAER